MSKIAVPILSAPEVLARQQKRTNGVRAYYRRCSAADLVAATKEHGDHLQAIYAEQRRRLAANDEPNPENL